MSGLYTDIPFHPIDQEKLDNWVKTCEEIAALPTLRGVVVCAIAENVKTHEMRGTFHMLGHDRHLAAQGLRYVVNRHLNEVLEGANGHD